MSALPSLIPVLVFWAWLITAAILTTLNSTSLSTQLRGWTASMSHSGKYIHLLPSHASLITVGASLICYLQESGRGQSCAAETGYIGDY